MADKKELTPEEAEEIFVERFAQLLVNQVLEEEREELTNKDH